MKGQPGVVNASVLTHSLLVMVHPTASIPNRSSRGYVRCTRIRMAWQACDGPAAFFTRTFE